MAERRSLWQWEHEALVVPMVVGQEVEKGEQTKIYNLEKPALVSCLCQLDPSRGFQSLPESK